MAAMLYSETDEHLNNLDACGSRDLKRAYLAILLAAERCGFRAIATPKGATRELQIRDADDRQPFALIVHRDFLMFNLRRPALDERPDLAGQAQLRFPDHSVAGQPPSEVRIRVMSERAADDIADWLFTARVLTPGYGARRSA